MLAARLRQCVFGPSLAWRGWPAGAAAGTAAAAELHVTGAVPAPGAPNQDGSGTMCWFWCQRA